MNDFVKHTGHSCPVKSDSWVIYRTSNGNKITHIHKAHRASDIQWGNGYHWTIYDYKVVKEPKHAFYPPLWSPSEMRRKDQAMKNIDEVFKAARIKPSSKKKLDKV
jgi:hypothetical protein